MSRRKRHVDEEDFDEYAFYDERIRGDAHRRLDDGPPALQDYGLGPGYLGRARQSPRSPSIVGDDEIRPARRRDASPDDSDRGGERRAFRKVGDAYDPDDVFDEPFVFIEPGSIPPVVRSSEVRRALSSRVWADGYRGTTPSGDVTNPAWSSNLMGSAEPTGAGDIWSKFPNVNHIKFESLQFRLLFTTLRTSRVVYAEGTEPRLNYYIRDRYLHLAVVYDRQPEKWIDKTRTNVSWKDVFKSDYKFYAEPNLVGYSNMQFMEFTNQENAHRFRVMWRKCVNVPVKRVFLPKERVLTGSIVGDVGVQPTILNLSGLVQDPLAVGWEIEEFDSVFMDEFINLCGLPGKKPIDADHFNKGAFLVVASTNYNDSDHWTAQGDFPSVIWYYRLTGQGY